MKLHWLIIPLLAAVGLARGAEPFSQHITRDEFTQAGLDKLTPEECAKLDALVAKYFSFRMDALVAGAEAAAANAKQDAGIAPAKTEKSSGGLFSHLLAKSDAKSEPDVTESRIVGKLSGWNEKTIFILENGQRWQVGNYSKYNIYPPVENAKVSIRKTTFSYTMKIEGVDGEVRVRPLDEK